MSESTDTLLALRVTQHTMVGVRGKPPYKLGNCFSIGVKGGKEYRIVNFVLENLEHCLSKGISWPVKIRVIGPRSAIIHDERIPDEFYAGEYCEICCRKELLPRNQLDRIERHKARGQRVELEGFIRIDPSKRPILQP